MQLPPEPSPDSAARIDQVCDRFEAAWRAGGQAQIEQYLIDVPANKHAGLLRELLAAELELRAQAGVEARLEEYLARFPDSPEIVREAFGTTPTVRHAARSGPDVTRDHRAGPWAMQVRCPHCHNPIELIESDSLREIKCPSCDSLFSLVGSDGQRADAVGKTIGHFELLEKLGTGGFGTVWKARDTKLDRIVALKIPRRSQLDADELEKFFREARAAAQLKHPNIVSVHEVGRDGETVYIVSDYIEGLPLDKWLAGEGPVASAVPPPISRRALAPGLSPGGPKITHREAAALCEKIARALHHAHEAGVVHRDLKPSNIILDRSGEPHVMDFGLAKREAGEITMTVDGQILGTPAYMSPEQARGEGHKADRRTDIYSLGVILYQLLTGELPFRGSMRMLLAQVLEEDPLPPRKLDGTIPRDIETIVLRCMEKEPDKRYATSEVVGAELSRFQRGEPIKARPVGRVERAWRWCKRSPIVAGLGTAVFVVLLTGVVVSSYLLLIANRARGRASQEASRANEQTKQALESAAKERSARESMEYQLKCTDDARHSLLWGAAQRAFHKNDVSEAELNLAEVTSEHQNDWPTRHLRASCWRKAMTLKGHTQAVRGVACSPDGKRIVSASRDKTIKIWDTSTGQEILNLKGHGGEVTSVTFSADGQRIVSGSGDTTLRIWNATTGANIFTLKGHLGDVTSVAVSPDNRHIVSGSEDATLKVWDLNSGKEILTLKGHRGAVHSVAFAPDGSRIVSGSWDKTLKIWDTSSGRELLALKGHDGFGEVFSVAFSSDGQRIVSGSLDTTLKVWDATSGKEIARFNGHTSRVTSVAFFPDGRRIASGSRDNTVKIWDTVTGQATFTLRGHWSEISCVTISHDGRRIISGSWDNTLRVWDVTSGQETLSLDGFRDATFSPNGRLIAGHARDGTVRVLDPHTGHVWLKLTRHGRPIHSVVFSPDGARIADELAVWDVSSGKEVFRFEGGRHGVSSSLAFSPNGDRIVSGLFDGAITIWDASSGKEIFTLKGHTDEVRGVAFSPDGRRIVSGSKDQKLKVWDAKSGREIRSLKVPSHFITSVAYSPDNMRIVSGSEDSTLKVWDASSGKELFTLKGHRGRVNSVAFAPDSTRIVSGSWDKTLKIWDIISGQNILTLEGHAGEVQSVGFSPDGEQIASASIDDGTLKIWDAAGPKSNIQGKNGKDAVAGLAQSGPLPLPRGSRTSTENATFRTWSDSRNRKTQAKLSPVEVDTVRLERNSGKVVTSPLATPSSEGQRFIKQEMLTLQGHAQHVTSVAFSPDGRRIASGSGDNTVKIWDATTGQETLTLKGHRNSVDGVTFSPDGRQIVSGSKDNTLKVWDSITGKEILTFNGHTLGVLSVAFSPDGRRIVSGSWDHTVKIWMATTGQEPLTLKGHTNSIKSVAFSPDSQRIISGSYDGSVRVWDATSGQKALMLTDSAAVMSVAFSPDGKRIVSGSFDMSVKVWDATSGQETLSLKGHTGFVQSVVFSSDGRRIVSGSDDSTLKVWDATTGRETMTLKGHTDSVKCVALSPDGRRIVSGSADKTLKVWDAVSENQK